MRFIKQVVWVAALALTVNAFAHGGGEHLMGTVQAVDEKGLTLKTKDNKEAKVVFNDKTQFENAGAASSAKELKVGDRVVVHTAKREGAADPVAILVKFGASPPLHAGHPSAQ